MEVKVDYSYFKASGDVEKTFIILVNKVNQSMADEEIIKIAKQEIFKQHGVSNAIIGNFSELQ